MNAGQKVLDSINQQLFQDVNLAIKDFPSELRNQVSDGYHTFGELYDHRIELYIKLLSTLSGVHPRYVPWRTTAHSDGSVWDGWFLLGIGKETGKQITYHLPMSRWKECPFALTIAKAPEWDGHTSADVLERLKNL